MEGKADSIYHPQLLSERMTQLCISLWRTENPERCNGDKYNWVKYVGNYKYTDRNISNGIKSIEWLKNEAEL